MTIIVTSLATIVLLAILAQLIVKAWSWRDCIVTITPSNYKVQKPFKVFYIGNYGEKSKYGVISVVTEVVGNGWLRVGFSFCSPKDNFVKKTGREIARSKMFWTTEFTGHSSEDVVRLFNDEMRVDGKPGRWRKMKLFLEKDYTVGAYRDNGKTWDD